MEDQGTRLGQLLAPIEGPVARFVQDKLPVIPAGTQEPIVRFLPWVYVISGGLGLLVWLLGLLAIAAAGAVLIGLGAADPGLLGPLATYLLIPIELALSIVAGVLLFQRGATGWYLALISELASIVISLFSLAVGGIVWSLAWLWLLFAVREHYPPVPADVAVDPGAPATS